MFARLWFLPLLVVVSALLIVVPTREAEAHPLGNFTINHYSKLEFSNGEAHITYVNDVAEIPTFQRKSQLDTNGDGKLSDKEAHSYLNDELPTLVKGLQLRVDGETLPLEVRDSSAEYRPGQGGLPTLRIEAHLSAELPNGWNNATAHYTDNNYEDHLGWREIVVQGGPGVAIKNSTVPSKGVSNELRKYPQDMLSSPLDIREAEFTLAPANGSAASNTAGQGAGLSSGAKGNYSFGTNGYIGKLYSQLNSLISLTSPSPVVVLISFLAALLWGGVHALTPGHGKTIVAAYLVGERGTAKHAGLLGLTVTLTHTAGVFALGGIAIYLSRYILPETLFPWLYVVSGLLVVVIGLALLYSRLRPMLGTSNRGKSGHAHSHGGGREHTHSHDDTHPHALEDHQHQHADGHDTHTHSHDDHSHSHGGHAHSHLLPGADGSKVGVRSLLALGISGGLVPCPAALVLLLSAISLGRIGFGMVLVVVFSMGLAVVLTGIGFLAVYARRLFKRFSFETRMPRFLAVASALIISVVGVVILVGALGRTGLV